MTLLETVKKATDFLPKYWPLTMFVHHNPLHEFEHMHFKDALKVASKMFDTDLYMDPSYYVDLYKSGVIRKDILENNIFQFLNSNSFDIDKYKVRKFMIDLSPNWLKLKYDYNIDYNLDSYQVLREAITSDKMYNNLDFLFEEIMSHYSFSKLLDIIFGQNIYQVFYNEVIEFVSRFLDEGQASITFPFREKGMWECFLLFEGQSFNIEDILNNFQKEIKPHNLLNYIQRLLVNFFGWASFIKYRENTPYYPYQEENPADLLSFISIILYYELKYIKKMNKTNIRNYDDLYNYFQNNREEIILKLLAYSRELPPEYISEIFKKNPDYKSIFKRYMEEDINREISRIAYVNEKLFKIEDPMEVYRLIKLIKEEEGYIWTKSIEESYAVLYGNEFLREYKPTEKPKAAAVFCVDVRSEAIRRNIERIDNYKTYGVAGFFGIKVALIEFDKSHELLLCPAMESPEKVIFELPSQSTSDYEKKKDILYTLKKTLDKLKNNPYTPFFTVEAFGWLFGYNLFGKTFLPKYLSKFNQKIKAKPPKTIYSLDKLSDEEVEKYTEKFFVEKILHVFEMESDHRSYEEAKEILNKMLNDNLDEREKKILDKHKINKDYFHYIKYKFSNIGYTLEEKAKVADNFLNLIGMTDNFPPFVFLVGHGSVSDNNPYESALDCGACGGNSGYHNVRAMSIILNNREVRKIMNIKIPEDTIFIPALHNTTTDEVEFFDEELIPSTKIELFEEIKRDFKIASARTRQERIKVLPYADSEEDILVRAVDWSEMRPEWGLSSNIGVFVGRRESCMNSILRNRFFLHSYDYTLDPENVILKRILNGPFLIAQWINAEHYFSTVSNEVFGSGSKVYHNVVGRFGVFNSNYSDLKIGLPYQTVYFENKAFHEPARIVVFVEAPLEKVVSAASETDHPMMLLKNEWVRLVVIDREKNKLFLLDNLNFNEL
ncbi:MAG: putative inorganic carbon transporter subunit DabA [Hydrogenothermaceae bacterium]